MSESLSEFRTEPSEYKNDSYLSKHVPAIDKVAAVTGVSAGNWRIREDYQQSSCVEAGKSCCTFLAARFSSLEEALDAMKLLRRDLPTVNLELIVAPDGRRDEGAGPACYDRISEGRREVGSYLANEGFSAALLVDLQNVNRHLAQGRGPRNAFKPASPRF
jgi:hypothetical protein